MEIRVLGPLEVLDDSGAPVPVPGAKLRSLLAALAIRPGQVVPADRLVEELWGDDATLTAANSLQALVSKLRKVLPSDAVVTRPPGYLLDVAADSVDSGRFAKLAAEGRAALAGGDEHTAASTLREALGLWRGEALVEFAYEEFARGEATRLNEERMSVLEDRIDADLACGRHNESVAELEALVAAEPLRERRRAQLMLALYRSGRQADALRQYQEARRVLGEELGLEPGPELRNLESAVLANAPALEAPEREAPLPPARPTRRSNIPTPLTPTIGRDDDLADLEKALAGGRLVTVVGPGGVGKTRLAIEAARSLQVTFVHGAWLVELARINSSDAVVSAISTTLSVPDVPGATADPDHALERVAEFLSGKEGLLVLDNCEHVIDRVAAVAESLLVACPDLKILATSRESLGVPGEHLWAARPLPLGAAKALFGERAASVNPTFSVTTDNEATVDEICARVDGLPLAIELAAARVRAFPVAQIAARLDDRFRLLSGGARTAEARQQSLHAVVDWSYDLLFDDERRLFQRLSVFAGGCNVKGAQQVCADEQLPAADVPDLLARLVDKSVVLVDQAGEESRFSMLQTLADYAGERLAASGDEEAVRRRHRRWFAALAASSYPAFKGDGHIAWIRSVATETDNLRAALASAVADGDAESALGLAAGVGWYWQESGRPSEGLRWLDEAFACAGETPAATPATPATECHALIWRKILSGQAGLPDPGPGTEEIIAYARRAEDPELVAWSQVLLAEPAIARGDVAAAFELYRSARAYHCMQMATDAFSASVVAWIDANTALLSGDYEAAERQWARLAELSRETGSTTLELAACVQMSNLAESRGDYALTADLLERAMRIAGELGFHARDLTLFFVRRANLAVLTGQADLANELFAEAERVAADEAVRPVLARAVSGLAGRHRHAERLDAAADAAKRALALHEATGFAPGVVATLCLVGFISEVKGDAAEAERLHRQALEVAQRIEEPKAVALCLEGLAGVALSRGEAPRCASLLGAAARLRDSPGLRPDAVVAMAGTMRVLSAASLEDRFDAERIEAQARKLLGKPKFDKAYASGASTEIEDLTRSS